MSEENTILKFLYDNRNIEERGGWISSKKISKVTKLDEKLIKEKIKDLVLIDKYIEVPGGADLYNFESRWLARITGDGTRFVKNNYKNDKELEKNMKIDIKNENNNYLTQNINLDIKNILENKLNGEQRKELEEIYKTEDPEEKKSKTLEFIKNHGVVAVELLATVWKTLNS